MKKSFKLAALVSTIVCICTFCKANLLLPEGMKQSTYCATCSISLKAFVNAYDKGAALRSACSRKNLEQMITKDQSLEDVHKTCTHLLKLHGKALSKEISIKKGEKLEEWFCINQSYACLGVNRAGKADFGKGDRERNTIKKLKKHKTMIEEQENKQNPIHLRKKDSENEMKLIREYVKKNKDRVRVPYPHLYKEEL